MPLYEYACTSCGHRFERIQKFSDSPVTACPACGGAVEKLVSSPAIQFKGSGWYITDYAKSGGGKDAARPAADKGESSTSTTTASSPSDTTAAKNETASTSAAPAKTDAK